MNKPGWRQSIKKRWRLFTRLKDGLSNLETVECYCAENNKNHVALISVNIKGMDPGDAGSILDADYNIAVRTGLHCAPLVHEGIGTFPGGTVRFSLGPFNTDEHIDKAIEAMTAIDRYNRALKKLSINGTRLQGTRKNNLYIFCMERGQGDFF